MLPSTDPVLDLMRLHVASIREADDMLERAGDLLDSLSALAARAETRAETMVAMTHHDAQIAHWKAAQLASALRQASNILARGMQAFAAKTEAELTVTNDHWFMPGLPGHITGD